MALHLLEAGGGLDQICSCKFPALMSLGFLPKGGDDGKWRITGRRRRRRWFKRSKNRSGNEIIVLPCCDAYSMNRASSNKSNCFCYDNYKIKQEIIALDRDSSDRPIAWMKLTINTGCNYVIARYRTDFRK